MIPELDGYRYDFVFNHAYHRPLSPTWLRLLANTGSFEFPASRPLRYLELGYGTGVNLVVHAAAVPGEYWGTDINPAHAREARSLADAAGVDVRLLDLSFAQLADHPDLPQFDVIVAHGVWSWISPRNRDIIVEILKRHLVEGGLFFMSAAALPAEAEIVPLQRLLRREKAEDPLAALGLATRLQAAGSRFLSPDSRAGRRLEALKEFSRENLVHDYLNAQREPFLFCEIADSLAAAGLRFAASAQLLDRFEALRFTTEQRALLAGIDDPAMRETARDFLRPRQYRHDLFIKANETRPIPAASRDPEFVLFAAPLAARDRKLGMPLLDLPLDDPPAMAILDRLAEDDYRPKRLSELPGADDVPHILHALIMDELVSPAQPAAEARQAAAACTRFNAEILRRSRTEDTIQVLASPVTGMGVPLSRAQRLLLLAAREGAQDPQQLIRAVGTHLHMPTRDLLAETLLFQTHQACFRALGLLPPSSE